MTELPSVIARFTGEYEFLSNFWRTAHGTTVEHQFQACKTDDPHEATWIRSALTPAEAKRRGRQSHLRADWEKVKRQVMLALVLAKFNDPELRARLVATAPAILVEGNDWGDAYWGAVQGPGQRDPSALLWLTDDGAQYQGANWLGQILMMVRDVSA